MMKRLIALLSLLLFLPCLALGEDAPAPEPAKNALSLTALKKGDTTPDYDLLDRIDEQNDEARLVESEGAIYVLMHTNARRGQPASEIMVVITALGSRKLQMFYAPEAPDIGRLETGQSTFYFRDGEIYARAAADEDEFNWTWQSYLFPFNSVKAQLDYRQDENGFSYLLLEGQDGMVTEFVLAEDLTVLEARLYYENLLPGIYYYTALVTWTAGPAPHIPEEWLTTIFPD